LTDQPARPLPRQQEFECDAIHFLKFLLNVFVQPSRVQRQQQQLSFHIKTSRKKCFQPSKTLTFSKVGSGISWSEGVYSPSVITLDRNFRGNVSMACV
jgi:hypothetical protein